MVCNWIIGICHRFSYRLVVVEQSKGQMTSPSFVKTYSAKRLCFQLSSYPRLQAKELLQESLFRARCIYIMYIGEFNMARQISVSNEVYELLSKRKGKKSFSQVIKENLCSLEGKKDIMSFAGVMKNEKDKLELLKLKIAAEREANYGRALK